VTKRSPKGKIVLIGTLSGAVILGLLARLTMAIIALSSNHPVNLSIRSIAEVIVVGAVVGAMGSIVLLGLRTLISPGIARGIILGFLLFSGSLMIGLMAGRVAFGEQPITFITFALLGVVFVLYGIVTEWMVGRNKC
jgi:hypothetical protein